MRSDRLAVRRCFSVEELDFEVFVDTNTQTANAWNPQKVMVWEKVFFRISC